MTDSDIQPPSKLLLAVEGRAIVELGALLFAYPLLRLAPRGDGHPVLVLPGLVATDASTELLRGYLNDLGYSSHGWELGRNYGHHHTVEGEMLDRLLELHRRYKRKVSVIGWSLGGVFARELAKAAPEAVRLVISLGSPIACCPTATNAWRLYEFTSGQRASKACRRKVGVRSLNALDPEHEKDCPTCAHARRQPPSVPSTSIFSRSDGVVAWRCSLELPTDRTENIEVEGSHVGLGFNPTVFYAIADRLAQPEGTWAPFDRSGWRALLYPNPTRDIEPTPAVQVGETTERVQR